VGNREDAEDLASEVFLKASRHLEAGRAEASIASWLYTVARTVLADHWRRYYRQPAPLYLENLDALATAPEKGPANSRPESEHMVAGILEALPPRYRQVLELRFLRGCSVEEAAREMQTTAGNVKVLQHRALARAAGLFEMSEPQAEKRELVGCGCGSEEGRD
jgi:RNA polymerase sigma-70 factor (ECF subfamily)